MQTFPSHALLGVLTGLTAVTTGLIHGPLWLATVVGCIGALAPDLVMVPMFVRDKLQGRQPMTQQGWLIMALKELSHSLPLWFSLLVVAWFTFSGSTAREMSMLFLWSGILGGVLPDIPTHSEERFRDTDCTFIYPLGKLLKPLIGIDVLRWPTTRWEYRIDHGYLWPFSPWKVAVKPWERTFNYALMAIIACMLML